MTKKAGLDLFIASALLFGGLLSPFMAAGAEQPTLYGEMIRRAKVEGFTAHYHLLDATQRAALVKGLALDKAGAAQPTDQSNYLLLLYLWTPETKDLQTAKVTYEIAGPDGVIQTVHAFPIQAGYGAYVDMGKGGEYRIRMEADVGSAVLVDEFTHTRQGRSP